MFKLYIILQFDIKITRGQSRPYCAALSLHTLPGRGQTEGGCPPPRPRPWCWWVAASCAATWSPTSSTGQASRHEAGHNSGLAQVPLQHPLHPPQHPDLPQHAARPLHEHHQQRHGDQSPVAVAVVSRPELCLQNAGVLYRLTLGPQPALLARLTNCGLYLGFYMFLATNCCITIFRTQWPVSSVWRWSG